MKKRRASSKSERTTNVDESNQDAGASAAVTQAGNTDEAKKNSDDAAGEDLKNNE